MGKEKEKEKEIETETNTEKKRATEDPLLPYLYLPEEMWTSTFSLAWCGMLENSRDPYFVSHIFYLLEKGQAKEMTEEEEEDESQGEDGEDSSSDSILKKKFNLMEGIKAKVSQAFRYDRSSLLLFHSHVLKCKEEVYRNEGKKLVERLLHVKIADMR